jgi:hypothetical protein
MIVVATMLVIVKTALTDTCDDVVEAFTWVTVCLVKAVRKRGRRYEEDVTSASQDRGQYSDFRVCPDGIRPGAKT